MMVEEGGGFVPLVVPAGKVLTIRQVTVLAEELREVPVGRLLCKLRESYILSVGGYTRMAVYLKSPQADELARELARLRGCSITVAVIGALESELKREKAREGGRKLEQRLLDLSRRSAALPDFDTRDADEIVGYDEHGLPA